MSVVIVRADITIPMQALGLVCSKAIHATGGSTSQLHFNQAMYRLKTTILHMNNEWLAQRKCAVRF